MQENPESALHRREIEKERTSRRRFGIASMWLMGVFFVAFTIFCVTLQISNPVALGLFLELYLPVTAMLAGLFYLMGYIEYQRGLQPIPDQEVEQRRQEERAKLFLQAQGVLLPAYYKPWRLWVERIAGFIFLVAGILCLILVRWQQPVWLLIVYGVTFTVAGVFFLVFAFYVKPRRAKQVPIWSSQILRRRMARGEMTEGSIVGEDEPKGQ